MIRSINIFILLTLVIYYNYVPDVMDRKVMILILLLVGVSLLSFSLHKESEEKLKGQFLKHSIFIILGFIIVHFQFYLDYIVGNLSENDIKIWINTKIVNKTMILSAAGLVSFIIGYSNYKTKKRLTDNSPLRYKPIHVKVLVFIAAVSLVAFFLTVNPLYLIGYYGIVEMGTEATYAILIFTICLFAIIVQNCRNMVVSGNIPSNFRDYSKYHGHLVLFLIGIYLLSVMISGDRGPLISIGLAYLSGYYIVTKKKLKFKYGLLFIAIGAFLMTLLGIVRNQDKNLDFKTKVLSSLNAEKNEFNESFLPQTEELARSVRSLHTTVNYIPGNQYYLLGRFQLQHITLTVPFVSVFTPLMFDEYGYKYRGSASFVTWINQGEYRSSGEGTTCIADFYFDFGFVGVIIGMFFFGYLIRYAEVAMYSNNLPSLFSHIFIVVYLSYAIYIARSAVLFNLKIVVWVFILLIINKYLFNRRRI